MIQNNSNTHNHIHTFLVLDIKLKMTSRDQHVYLLSLGHCGDSNTYSLYSMFSKLRNLLQTMVTFFEVTTLNILYTNRIFFIQTGQLDHGKQKPYHLSESGTWERRNGEKLHRIFCTE